MAIATVGRWRMQKDCRVHIIQWQDGLKYDWWKGHREKEWICECINIPESPFSTWSLQQAELLSESNPYIICNDDSLIYGQDFVSKGLSLMERYPDFGIISAMHVNGHGYNTENEVTEVHAVGGLVFLRKGLVTEFPPLPDSQWDGDRHRQIINKGYKSGYARDLKYLHIGEHFSIASPAYFTGA